jgi:nitroreductase
MNSIIEAIRARHAVRNYSSRAIEDEKMQQLREFLDSNRKGPMGSDVRFEIVDGSVYPEDMLRPPGSYGLIRGHRMFIAGAVNRNRYAREDFGYCMEKNVLMATNIGLGTCWVGGTLNRSAFARKLEISDSEIVPAVTPIGYAEGKGTFKGRVTSLLARSGKRKEPKQIFFDRAFNNPLSLDESKEFSVVLECVRWAPSAGNLQPWRIVRENRTFHFFMKENDAYNSSTRYRRLLPGKGEKLQNVDMGIAMAHFDLAAAELGLRGEWRASEPRLDKKDLKYTASWLQVAG